MNMYITMSIKKCDRSVFKKKTDDFTSFLETLLEAVGYNLDVSIFGISCSIIALP